MGHNNLPRSRPAPLPGPTPQMPSLGLCVQCVAEHKGATLAAADKPVGEPVELPALAPAIMLVGGTGCCFTHLQVQSQSALLVPNGVPR